MRALAFAAVVIASFIISSIAWGPPLALITKQPGMPLAPINLSIVGAGNETGGIPTSSGSGGSLLGVGSNSSSPTIPENPQSPSVPNPFAGLGDAIGNVLNPGVNPERTETPRSGIALAFAVAAPVVLALAYYALYAGGKGRVVTVRRRRRLPRGTAGVTATLADEDNIFVRVVRLLSIKVSEVLGKDPDILTHREIMHHASKLLGWGDRVRAAIMGYEKLRFASRETDEDEVRAAEEVLRLASK